MANQLTGGSGSVRGSYSNLRKAGAAAREMLLSAAAAQWNVPRSECHAESSFVIHASTQRRLAFEQLLAAASALHPPADPPLKNPSDFTLIGKSTGRTDSLAKVIGSTKYGLDTRLPGMLIAAVEPSPGYGGAPPPSIPHQIHSAPRAPPDP